MYMYTYIALGPNHLTQFVKVRLKHTNSILRIQYHCVTIYNSPSIGQVYRSSSNKITISIRHVFTHNHTLPAISHIILKIA